MVKAMTNKIVNLDDYREQGIAAPIDEAIKRAVKHFFDPALAELEEPCGLASGDTSMPGKFVIDDDEVDDEDIHENR